MKIKNCLKILSVVGLFCAPSVAQANAVFNQTADIEVLRALTITENERLNFGVIDLPGSDVKVHITTSGVVGATETTATHINTTPIKMGEYTIKGSDSSQISITASNGGSVSGLTFERIEASYDSGPDVDLIAAALTGSAPTTTGKTLLVGAVLNVAAGITEGTYTPDFKLNIDYQ